MGAHYGGDGDADVHTEPSINKLSVVFQFYLFEFN